MKLFKKIAMASVVVAFLLTGCGGDVTWAYRSEGVQMPTGLYIIYEINAISQAGQIVTDENKDNAEFNVPKPAELLKMTVEGQSAADWIYTETQNQVREYYAVLKKFNELGLQLSDSELQSVDSSVNGVKAQSGDFYEKNGVADTSIKEYYMGQARKNRIFLALYDEGGEFEIPEDELKAYLTDNYAMVDAMPLYKPTYSDDETKTVEQLTEDMKSEAEGYLELMRNGTAIEDIAYDWQLKNTAEENHESVTKPLREDLRMILMDSDRESFGDLFVDAVFAARAGIPEMVEDSLFFAVFNRVDVLSDPEIFEGYRSVCMWGIKEEEYNEKLTEWGNLISLEPNTATLDRYKPSKLKLDDVTAAQ